MSKNDNKQKTEQNVDGKLTREERLREELRKNLRKRKGQKNASNQD